MTAAVCVAFSLVAVLASLVWLKRQGALAGAACKIGAFVLFAVQLVILVVLLWLLGSYQASPVYSIALCLVMIFCCIADSVFLQESASRLSERLRQEQSRSAETRLVAAERYQRALEAYVSQTDDLHRDLLAQIEDAKARLAAGQEDALQGVEASIRKIDEAAKVRRCQNGTIDALLALKALEAEGDSIEFSFSGEVPASLVIDELELCSVFSNLIDNALNAARSATGQARFVDVACSAKGAYLVLRVANGTAEGADGLPKKVAFRGASAKRLGAHSMFANRSVPEHGWGLKIVQDICARYDGELSLEREGDNAVAAVAIVSCVPALAEKNPCSATLPTV